MFGHPVAPTPGTPESVKHVPDVTIQVAPSCCHVWGGDISAASAALFVDFAICTPFSLMDTAVECIASRATFARDIQPQPLSGPSKATFCDASRDSPNEQPARFAS